MEKTPEEAWSKRKPSVKHLKVFGCKVSVMLTPKRKEKFGSKVWWGSFVGYGGRMAGYRLWDPVKQEIVIRKDVKFHEDQFYVPAKRPTEEERYITVNEVPITQPPVSDFSRENIPVELPHEASENPESESIPRKSSRIRRPPQRLTSERLGELHQAICIEEETEPKTLKEAMERSDWIQWEKAINEEMESLHENKTWSLVERPNNKNIVGSKFVFKLKRKSDGSLERHKARLVARGFTQEEGVDFSETFAPVLKMQSLRLLLALANNEQAHLHQMDVKTAFLYGELEEEVFMEQPEGMTKPGTEHMVCKLHKSLYGLKQSPRNWNKRIDKFFNSLGLSQIPEDHAVYVMKENPGLMFIGVYVDDLIIGSVNLTLLEEVKAALSSEFQMKDLGNASYVLGISVRRFGDTLFLSQKKYAKEILKKFGMEDCHGCKTLMERGELLDDAKSKICDEKIPYRAAIGSLMYLMTSTRPDLATSVSMLSRYFSEPRVVHWIAVKRVLRYLASTLDFGLKFRRSRDAKISGFSDADWAGDVQTRRSRSSYIFLYGGGPISWQSRLQDIVTLSSAEAEYVAATEGAKESVWISNFLKSVRAPNSRLELFVDNQSAIKLANNPVYHQRTKHIDVRYHKIREWVAEKRLELKYVHTRENAADFLTKIVSPAVFEHNRELTGVVKEQIV